MHRVDPPASHVDLLARPLFAHLATVAGNGSPRVNPMWFIWDGDRGLLKMSHTTLRRTYRNLQLDGRVALSITDPDNQYRYLQLRGFVEHVDSDPTGAFHQSLRLRYGLRSAEVEDRDVRIIISVRPTAWKARDA